MKMQCACTSYPKEKSFVPIVDVVQNNTVQLTSCFIV